MARYSDDYTTAVTLSVLDRLIDRTIPERRVDLYPDAARNRCGN